jgi:hypothetical protein
MDEQDLVVHPCSVPKYLAEGCASGHLVICSGISSSVLMEDFQVRFFQVTLNWGQISHSQFCLCTLLWLVGWEEV